MMKKKIKKLISSLPQITKVRVDAEVTISNTGEIILYSIEDKTINSGDNEFVQTGIKLYIPAGTVGIFRSIASMFINNNVYVHPAKMIESSTESEIYVLLRNDGDKPFVISKKDQLAVVMIYDMKSIKNIKVNEVKL